MHMSVEYLQFFKKTVNVLLVDDLPAISFEIFYINDRTCLTSVEHG
jgi:hypothetical protein